MKSYSVLHCHSHYSLLDGLSKCEDIVNRGDKIGAKAVALTDHGNVSGAVDFIQSIKEAKSNIKPIFGCEMYVCKQDASIKTQENRKLSHQVILAKNAQGWKDLLWLVSLSNHNNLFFYKPRLDLARIANVASNGNLISFSGHLGSTLANSIVENDELIPDWLKIGCYTAYKLRDMFGKDNFFIEIQMIDSLANDLARKVGEAMREIARRTKIPTVATPDAHYCEKKDADDHRILLATNLKKTLPQIKREIKSGNSVGLDAFFKSSQYYIPSYEELLQYNTEEEIENTNTIADMCDDYDITKNPEPPYFECPDGMSDNEYLRQLCRKGWLEKYNHITKDHPDFKKYGDRVNHELDIFTSLGLSSYFLIVHDILNFVRSKGCITGVGRGSSAGSIVANLINITQIDPIKYNLFFERFYNAGRNSPGKISWPDIDFDIPKGIRKETIEYIRNKYGEENVAQIITFQTLKGRGSLTKVMAAQGGISFDEQKAITKHLPEEAKIADELQIMEDEYGYASSIQYTLEHTPDKLKSWCYIDKNGNLSGPMAQLFQQAIRLEGTKITASTHAAGIIISRNPIYESCPLMLNKDGDQLLAGFEGPYCEAVGILKFDCLAIRGLDKIMDIVDLIKKE